MTDPARIAEWIWNKLEEEAPYIDMDELLERSIELAEEIVEQSKYALDEDTIMDWFIEYYGDKLDELLQEHYENIEKMIYDKLSELLENKIKEETEK